MAVETTSMITTRQLFIAFLEALVLYLSFLAFLGGTALLTAKVNLAILSFLAYLFANEIRFLFQLPTLDHLLVG